MNLFNFRDVDWGPDEAKGDVRLRDYFIEIPEYSGLIDGTYRYIIGRKGTGKTALCERIRQDAENNPFWFSHTLSLRNLPLPIVRSLRDKSLRDKCQFVPIWSFLIILKLIQMILEDEGSGPADIKSELQQFIEINFPDKSFGFSETLTLLKNSNAKINFSTKWLGGSKEAGESTSRTCSIHYLQANETLIKKIQQITSKANYFLFMDELDEGYQAGDKNLRLTLLALLRATEELALMFGNSNISFRPILVLRSDIFDKLEDNDLNKLDDYLVRLNWHNLSQTGYSLRDLVNARIGASIDIRSNDRWNYVACDNDNNLPKKVKTLWDYMVNRTFERPRDIIKFLKIARKQDFQGRLDFEKVKVADHDYSKWLYNELRDEIHGHLSVWKEALQCITKIGRGIIETDVLKRLIESDPKIKEWMKNNSSTSNDVISILFDFGVIGNLDSRTSSERWLFKYKEDDLVWNPSLKNIVHFGFTNKLRIKSF